MKKTLTKKYINDNSFIFVFIIYLIGIFAFCLVGYDFVCGLLLKKNLNGNVSNIIALCLIPILTVLIAKLIDRAIDNSRLAIYCVEIVDKTINEIPKLYNINPRYKGMILHHCLRFDCSFDYQQISSALNHDPLHCVCVDLKTYNSVEIGDYCYVVFQITKSTTMAHVFPVKQFELSDDLSNFLVNS